MKNYLKYGFLLFCFFPFMAYSQYPVPALPADTSQFGKKISRTLSLLGTSTASNRKKVKILVYGQSISEQDWWNQVKTWLQSTYPYADLEMINRAIGGYSSQMLWRTCEMDVTSFYPDLVIFHVYGNHYFYETLMRLIRGRTAAEILVQTDHITGSENNVSLTDMSNWSNHMCFEVIPGYAAIYGMEVIDTRTQWKKYLTDNGLNSSQLTTDGTHLNDQGNFVQAQLTERHLVYKAKFPADPDTLCRIYEVGKDVMINGGKITLPFRGNKVEIIPSQQKAVKLYVKIDGKKPHEFPTCYNITRPCISGSFWNGGFSAKPSITPPVAQNWTLEFTSKTGFKVTGSITGLDGTGDATARFVSNSGQVVIQPQDWWTPLSWEPGTPWKFSTGSKVNWVSYGMFVDSLDCSTLTVTPGYENPVNLVQGLPNGNHTLELTSSTGEFPVKYIKIYKPYVNLTITTSKDTIRMPAAGGSTSVTVNTNTFWQSWCYASWFSCNTVDNYSASDDLRLFDEMTITVTVNANTTGSQRTSTLLLSGIGAMKSIVVVQEGTASSYTLLKDSELSGKTYGDPPFDLTNDAIGKTVIYSSSNPAIASITGNRVTIRGAGTVNITAQIQGDASSAVTKPLVIAKKNLTVSTSSVWRTVGSPNPPFVLVYSGFVNGDDESVLDVKPVATCQANESSAPGTYSIIISGGSDNNYSFTYINTAKLTVAGLALAEEDVSVTLFPNPVRHQFTLSGVALPVTVEIYDAGGKLMKTDLSTDGTFVVEKLPAGSYIVKINTGKGWLIRKIVVE